MFFFMFQYSNYQLRRSCPLLFCIIAHYVLNNPNFLLILIIN